MEAYLDEIQKIGTTVRPSATFLANLNPLRAFSGKAARAKGVGGPVPLAIKSPPLVPGVGRPKKSTNLTGGQNIGIPSVTKTRVG